MNTRNKPRECQLCQRVIGLTFHHLIPRKVHSRPRFRKKFSREALNQGVWLCRDCHRAVHRFYDEITLAKEYNSLEALLNSEIIQRHIDWQRRQRRRI
ncbi:MAG TPA: hypothetical protein VLA39_02880 [Marinobacterium sp.]|nr:hypothetical protein [Marinobacterium sp.]